MDLMASGGVIGARAGRPALTQAWGADATTSIDSGREDPYRSDPDLRPTTRLVVGATARRDGL